jgi:hypothetical protein
MRPIERVLAALGDYTSTTDGNYSAHCPGHDDVHSSLSLTERDGRVLLHCHAGCPFRHVVEKLGLTKADLFPKELSGWSRTVDQKKPETKAEPTVDWAAQQESYRSRMTAKRMNLLAKNLGLPVSAVKQLRPGWHPTKKCFTIAETDGAGRVTGVATRDLSGQKQFIKGGHRGLTIPTHWQDRSDTLLLPEGPSCLAALLAMGLPGIGRPSCGGGVEHLVVLLKNIPADRRIVVLGENDAHDDGSWPGKDGAEKTARELAAKLGRPVSWALVPNGIKDTRDWVTKQKPDPTDRRALKALGTRFADLVTKDATIISPDVPQLAAARACDLEPLPILWLWEKYVPFSSITILDGNPGDGKSQITNDLAARVSRGRPMPPDDSRERVTPPAGVIILSAEDDAPRVIRPRLEAAGADLGRVVIVDGVRTSNSDRPVVLPDDLGLLQAKTERIRAKLIVVDPLMAFLTGGVDAHKDSDVRRVLYQLKRFADVTGAAILVVRHLNKVTTCSSAMYRGGGSIGIIGAARSALLVGKSPDDEGVRVLASVKSNLGPMPPALSYTIEPAGDVSRIRWGEEVDLFADELIRGGTLGRPVKQRGEAEDLLREQLANSPMSVEAVEKAALAAGISIRTLDRARHDLGIRATRSSSGWVIAMPGGEKEERSMVPKQGCQKSKEGLAHLKRTRVPQEP